MTKTDNETMIVCSFMVYDDETQRVTFTTNIAVLVLNSILAVTTTVQNLPVIYAILKTPSLHNPPNILLCSLATSDLLVGCAIQPLAIANIAEILNGHFSCALWKAKESLLLFFMYVSILTLVMISTERWLALHFHLRYRELITSKRTLMCVSGTWFFSGVSIIAWPLGLDFYTFTLLGISVISIAAVLLVLTYVKIFVILRRHQRLIEHQTQLHQPTVNVRRHRRSSATMLYVVILFFLFYLPTFYAMVLYLAADDPNRASVSQLILWEVAKTVALVNASANPVLYYWKMKDIRRAVRNAFGSSTMKVQVGDVITPGSGSVGNDYRSRTEQRHGSFALKPRLSCSSEVLSRSEFHENQETKEQTAKKKLFLMPRYLEPGPSYRT